MQDQENSKPPSQAKLLLTMEEAAEMLSFSRRFFYDLVMSHQIDSIKVGRSRRVPLLALQAFVEQQLQAK